MEAADALDWTRARAGRRRVATAVPIMLGSIARGDVSLPPRSRRSRAEAVRLAALRAAADDMRTIEVWLTWPAACRLATAHPHGGSTTWLA